MLKNRFFALLILVVFSVSCGKEDALSPLVGQTYHLKSVGASARDLLTSNTFTTLQIDLVYVEGFEPNATTLTNTVSFLANRLNKPGGISIKKTSIPSPGLAPYSVNDVIKVEEQNRTLFNEGNKLAVFVFVADGYADNNNVLGFAYRNTSVALFGKKINEISGGVGQPGRAILETTVMNHEFAHIMGLVNVGTPLQSAHQDEANGKHCNVESCLMYWAAETGDVVTNLAGLNQAPSLDSQCIADLQANGGK
jgi:hypothetical protein